MNVHAVAALFPMMSDEELDELAADIGGQGLLEPIVRDADGTLVDGRNRLEACRRAGVEPRYAELDGHDPVAFILGHNIARRHLSAGQRAMLVAKAHAVCGKPMSQLAADAGTSKSRVVYASVVLDWAPDLVDQIIAGGSLDQAYAVALDRKRGISMAKDEVEWTAEQAKRARQVAQNAKRTLVQELEQRKRAVELDIEEIGPEVAIRPAPDLSTDAGVQAMVSNDPAPLLGDSLDRQHRHLQRIISIRRELERFAQEEPVVDGWTPDGHIAAIRSAISQIVTTAYAIAERHTQALDGAKTLRVVS
jgi:hypothetical protein